MSALSAVDKIDKTRKEIRKRQLISTTIQDTFLQKVAKKARHKKRDFAQQTQTKNIVKYKARNVTQQLKKFKPNPFTSPYFKGSRFSRGSAGAPGVGRSGTRGRRTRYETPIGGKHMYSSGISVVSLGKKKWTTSGYQDIRHRGAKGIGPTKDISETFRAGYGPAFNPRLGGSTGVTRIDDEGRKRYGDTSKQYARGAYEQKLSGKSKDWRQRESWKKEASAQGLDRWTKERMFARGDQGMIKGDPLWEPRYKKMRNPVTGLPHPFWQKHAPPPSPEGRYGKARKLRAKLTAARDSVQAVYEGRTRKMKRLREAALSRGEEFQKDDPRSGARSSTTPRYQPWKYGVQSSPELAVMARNTRHGVIRPKTGSFARERQMREQAMREYWQRLANPQLNTWDRRKRKVNRLLEKGDYPS